MTTDNTLFPLYAALRRSWGDARIAAGNLLVRAGRATWPAAYRLGRDEGYVLGVVEAMREVRRAPRYDRDLGNGWVHLGTDGPAPQQGAEA